MSAFPEQILPPVSHRDIARLVLTAAQADQAVYYRGVRVGEQVNLVPSASYPDNAALTSHPLMVSPATALGRFLAGTPGAHELIDPLLLASPKDAKFQEALRGYRHGVLLSFPAAETDRSCLLVLYKNEQKLPLPALAAIRELVIRTETGNRALTKETGAPAAGESIAELKTRLVEVERINLGQVEFIAGLGHELKTPLNSIIGFGSLLEKQIMDEELSEEIDMIMVSANKLLELIEDLIDSYKAAAGKLILHRQTEDLNDVLGSSIEAIRVIADEKGITVRNYLAGQIPKFPFDRKRIQQVMNNLLGNALKFVPPGGEIIVRSMLQGDFARVTVTDTGQGIPANSIGTVFQRFKQLQGAEERDHHSAGMGLALCKDFIEMHGGVIKVSSEVGRGSVFEFTLPLTAAADE